MSGRLFWLASYPKSGNTWFRAFLQNLRNNADSPVSINDLATGTIASGREWIDSVAGFDTADLYPAEIARLRPAVYRWTSQTTKSHGYYKIHDACERVPGPGAEWLICAEATAGALYLIRNPLDVAISYANHNNCTIDEAIAKMANPAHCLARDRSRKLKNQTEQRLLTWSAHVESWVDCPDIDVAVIRYEDMQTAPMETFTRAARFLGLDAGEDAIDKAIRFSDFRILHAQETETPFKERPPASDAFSARARPGIGAIC